MLNDIVLFMHLEVFFLSQEASIHLRLRYVLFPEV